MKHEKKAKILVVEDEEITAMDIQNRLIQLGYDVPKTAATGKDAITLAKKLKPDLILMDVVLKGEMNGTEAARLISNQQHIPIIFVSAYNDEKTINSAKLSNPYGYLTKPFETRDLEISIDLALYKHRLELESARETSRLKNEFLENMTHEIRTPLNGIIGFAEMIYQSKSAFKPEVLKDYMNDILSSSRLLLNLLSDILDFTEAESEKMQFKPQSIEMKKIAQEVKDSLQELIESKRIQLEIKIDSVVIELDPEKLKKVLYHLLSNAIKFSREGGKVELITQPEEKEFIRIEVKDTGIGIPEEQINNLFIPFKQLDMSDAKKFQGAGLGLALTRRIVEAQGGQVGVKSAVGEGTTFYAVLPCKQSANTGSQA
jgi:signal transduction histidine kinase